MIAEFKPYPEYKESGLPWADRVPSHWSFRRTKVLFGERVQKGFPNEPLLAATQSKGVVKKTDYGERTVTASKDFHLLKLVEPGDFVISLRSFQGGLEIAHCRGIISPAYTVLKPRNEARRPYFKQFFKSPDFIDSMTLFVTGIREGQNIDYERLSRAYLPVPPVDEQESIGRFLDHWNGRLEKAIRAKRKVITLLNEQKQAIIHRAVTRGLDPNVKLKDSGIPWLGEIPEHWERIRLKFETSHIVDCLHATPTYIDDGVYPAIRTADIEPGKVRLDRARKIAPSEFRKWIERLKPEEGDILYSREGERFGIAANVPADTELCISQRMMVFRIRKPQNSEYVMWQLNCQHVYLQASLYVMGSTAPHVNVEQIKNFQLAFPPVEEQNRIAEHIRSECNTLTTAITRYEREIALLREYRTRLTADVVTGKLDVRAAAAQLPDPEEEPAELDAPEEESEMEEVEE